MPVDCNFAALGQDFGTSRWQLVIERYTNVPRLRKGALVAVNGPDRGRYRDFCQSDFLSACLPLAWKGVGGRGVRQARALPRAPSGCGA
jgi:hypothetical protein